MQHYEKQDNLQYSSSPPQWQHKCGTTVGNRTPCITFTNIVNYTKDTKAPMFLFASNMYLPGLSFGFLLCNTTMRY